MFWNESFVVFTSAICCSSLKFSLTLEIFWVCHVMKECHKKGQCQAESLLKKNHTSSNRLELCFWSNQMLCSIHLLAFFLWNWEIHWVCHFVKEFHLQEQCHAEIHLKIKPYRIVCSCVKFICQLFFSEIEKLLGLSLCEGVFRSRSIEFIHWCTMNF